MGTEEARLAGLGVAPGIAVGPAHIVESGFERVPEYTIEPNRVDDELQRLQTAIDRGLHQLGKLKRKSADLPEAAAEEVTYLLEAHESILSGSRLVRGIHRRIKEHRINAEYAVQAEVGDIARQFEAMDDAFLASRISEIREVGHRLIRNLTDRKFRAFSTLPPGSIILAEDLSPADTALMDPARIGGFATILGGPQGHTAIMARSLGLPAVLGTSGLLTGVRSGDTVVIDGTAGQVIVNPLPETMEEIDERRRSLESDLAQLRTLIDLPSETQDGTSIRLSVNLEFPREAEPAHLLGAEGVGLLRTEFLYMNRDDLPSEEEQTAALSDVVKAMEGRPVTIRTLDVGGDKLAWSLRDRFDDVQNPALGLRAIRLSLREPELLDTQLRAVLRAGALGPVRILLPMVTRTREVVAVRRRLTVAAESLKAEGIAIADPLPPVGAMVEVPAAAIAADLLATDVDFFALGTNDLVQYTLAIDRGDEQVADLYDPLHPAILRMIRHTATSALKHGIPVSVCGELAGDPTYTALLIGLGIRELSMSQSSLLRVKKRIRHLELRAAERHAQTIMATGDRGRIAALLADFDELSSL